MKSDISQKKRGAFFTASKGVLLASVVLVGNGIHPIINNIRPESLDALNFVFQMSLWEMIFALIFIGVQTVRNKIHSDPNSVSISQELPHPSPSKGGLRLRLVIIGLIFSGTTYLYIDGLSEAGAIAGSIALKISPLYAFILGVLFLGEIISWKQVALTAVMLFGLYYLGTAGTFIFGAFSLGFAKLLVVPLFWGIGHALTKPVLEKRLISPLQVILVRTSLIALVIGSITILLNGFSYLGNALLHPEYLFFSLIMGGTYFFMHISWYNSIKYIDLSYASALVTPSPALTTLLAVSLGLEELHYYDIIGMVVVFIALFGLIQVSKKRSDLN